MLDHFVQAGLVVFGGTAVYLFGCKDRDISRWGCVAALCAEPLWLYGAWIAGQWGVMIMACIYSIGWVRGIRNHFWRNE